MWGVGAVAPSSYVNGCQWLGSSTNAGFTGTVLAGFTETYPVQSEYAPGCRSPSWFEPSPCRNARTAAQATFPIPAGVSVLMVRLFGSYPRLAMSGSKTLALSNAKRSTSARQAA